MHGEHAAAEGSDAVKRLFFAVALLTLAACSGGGQIPTPSPPAPPPVTGTLAFQADFSGPSIGLTGYCSGDVPVACQLPAGAVWGTFSVPAGVGAAAFDPGPNAYYAASGGVLSLNAPAGVAFPIISAQTFPASSTLVFQATILAHVADATGWGGLVAYNGDAVAGGASSTGQWRALYYDAWSVAGEVQISVWGPTHIQTFTGQVYAQNTPHVLEMDYAPSGTWTYKVDGAVIGTEAPGSWSTDTTVFTNNPHVAIFLGAMQMQVSGLSVSEGP